jgi:hypothetical protein
MREPASRLLLLPGRTVHPLLLSPSASRPTLLHGFEIAGDEAPYSRHRQFAGSAAVLSKDGTTTYLLESQPRILWRSKQSTPAASR